MVYLWADGLYVKAGLEKNKAAITPSLYAPMRDSVDGMARGGRQREALGEAAVVVLEGRAHTGFASTGIAYPVGVRVEQLLDLSSP